MHRDRLLLGAAASRLVLGLCALTLLPLVYPGLAAHRWFFGAYLVFALGMQLLIWKGVGGMARAVAGGLVDMLVLTFLVHRVGSTATMMVSVYFFGAIVNTLVVGRRVGVTLAVASALFYCGVVISESVGLLPYAPDGPAWVQGRPDPAEAATVCGLMSILLIASAWIVGLLVHRIRTHEAELVAANVRLSELSSRDPLTQLFNRRHLMSRLDDELARVRRGHALSVIMVDLDRFKRVNDEQGHERGDQLLESIAKALASATREVDVPGRYGGDEFVVLLPDTQLADASTVAERLVLAVREIGLTYDAERPVTASVGVAVASAKDGARALIRRADERAYRAKQAGGDRACAELDGDDDALDGPGPRGKAPAEP